jgi:hypothetical protein
LATRLHTESPNCLIGSTIVFVIELDCIAAIIAIRKITTQKIFKNIAQINHHAISFILKPSSAPVFFADEFN